MKKFKHLPALCAAIVIGAAFFTACPDGNDDKPKGVTYTLNVSNVNVAQGKSAAITYTLTASDSSSTAEIPVTFACTTHNENCTLTINDGVVTAGGDEAMEPHSFTATAKKDDKTIATKSFTITVTDPGYDVDVTVTLGSEPEAQLEDGEYVWIAGAWYNNTWDKLVLTEQESGEWTVTIEGIPSDRAEWTYDIFAVKSPDTFGDDDWGIRLNGGNITYTHATNNGVINESVTAWRGRPVFVEGELLVNPGFDDGEGWSIGSVCPPWVITGLNQADLSNAWLSGDPPGSQGGAKHFRDFNQNSNSTYYLDNESTLSILQDVDAVTGSLSADVEVTLSVYIALFSTDQEDMELVVGSQTYDFTGDLDTNLAPGASAPWQKVSHTFTLAAGDIVNDKVTVGLQYTAGSGSCRTMIDTFSFMVAEEE